MKSLTSIFLCLSMAFIVGGCKKPPPPAKPTPTPTSTPQPLQDVIAFTEAGELHTVNWLGNTRQTLFSDSKKSVWFPTAANKAAQAVPGPAGRKGPHFIAWVSSPQGSQNIVRIYLDSSYIALTSISKRANREMKNLRLGNAPVYSHDGKRIAYSYNGDIWIMDSDGYNATTLIADGHSWSPAWSYNDTRLVYVNVYQGHSDLWVTQLTDRDTYQVTDFNNYQVGQPRFEPGDGRILLTRIQKDESDVVSVISNPDQPLADSEPVTRDLQSANAIFSPDGLRILYASGPLNPFKPGDPKTIKANKQIDPLTWYLWRAKPLGEEPVRLAEARGVSAAWLRPDVPQPTPTLRPTRPKHSAALAPTPKATTPPPTHKPKPQRPQKPHEVPTIAPTVAPTAPVQITHRPKPKLPKPPQHTVANTIQTPIPPQPVRQAPSLKLRVGIRFDPSSDEITLSSLGSVQKIAGRARQYPTQLIRVYGPLDTSPLRGAYPSSEARSKARAQKVAALIAKEKGVNANQIKTVPYIPQGLNSRPLTNGVEIYISKK